MTIHLKPEQARIVREEIRNGHFRNADEVLDHALATLRRTDQKAGTRAKPRKNLVEVLSQPPFAGSGLDFERQTDYPRPLDL